MKQPIYNIENNIIKPSIAEMAREFNLNYFGLRDSIIKEKIYTNRFFILEKYKDNKEKIEEIVYNNYKIYNKTLNKYYYNYQDAFKDTGVSIRSISRVCHGRGKKAGGYEWEFTENYIPTYGGNIKVRQKETNKIFHSLTDAGRAVGIHPCNIKKVIDGTRKTAGGYHWERVDYNDKQ